MNFCLLNFDLDRFSIECRKTRAKIVTTAGQKGGKYPEELMRTKVRENASDQVVIFFVSFAPDWLKKWRDFFGPITMKSKAKPKQPRMTLDTQLKIALFVGERCLHV